jgi:hypothetical protein
MAQGRRVRRVVRKIDTWSALKVSGLLSMSFVLVLIIAGILLWIVGSSVGAIGSVEKFLQAIGFEDFRFVASQLLRGFVAAGLVLVILGTGLSVLLAVIYNLISDIVGGLEVTVLEEDVRPAQDRPRTSAEVRAMAEEPSVRSGYPA